MDKQISNSIVEVCKKLGIDYKSVNPNYINFSNDAQLLAQLYKDLQQIAGKLVEISDRHDIPELKEMIKFDIDQIESVDHDLIRLAKRLKND